MRAALANCFYVVMVLVNPLFLAAQGLLPAEHFVATATAATVNASSGVPVTIPAGTVVLMTLRSPLSTVSARNGSGAYMETVFPLIVNDRVVLPARTQAQGVVTLAKRPGRLKGKGQLQLHLTSLVLPDQRVIAIAASVLGLAGSRTYMSNAEGGIHPVDQIDKDAGTMVRSTAAGAGIGAIGSGLGAGKSAAIGAGFGLAKILFSRGDDVHLAEGTKVEVVLDRAVVIQ